MLWNAFHLLLQLWRSYLDLIGYQRRLIGLEVIDDLPATLMIGPDAGSSATLPD